MILKTKASAWLVRVFKSIFGRWTLWSTRPMRASLAVVASMELSTKQPEGFCLKNAEPSKAVQLVTPGSPQATNYQPKVSQKWHFNKLFDHFFVSKVKWHVTFLLVFLPNFLTPSTVFSLQKLGSMCKIHNSSFPSCTSRPLFSGLKQC